LVKLAGKIVPPVEVELRAQHVPFRLAGKRGWSAARSAAWAISGKRRPRRIARTIRIRDRAAILYAAVDGRPFAFHFELHFEVGCFAALPDKIDRARRLLARRFDDDCSILHAPEAFVPIPTV